MCADGHGDVREYHDEELDIVRRHKQILRAFILGLLVPCNKCVCLRVEYCTKKGVNWFLR